MKKRRRQEIIKGGNEKGNDKEKEGGIKTGKKRNAKED